MSINNMLWLVLLSTISGSSFILTKDLSPIIGPILTTELRILLAAIFLVFYSFVINLDVEWKKYWKLYLIIGILNSVMPFLLYSYASLYVNASYLAIFNSTAPLFAALFAVIWLKQKLSLSKITGLLLGIFGVSLIVYDGTNNVTQELFYIGGVLCISAAMFYAMSGIYIKTVATEIKPLALATGSVTAASLILAPFVVFDTIEKSVIMANIFNFNIVINILLLSVVCSAIAYLIYFKLIKEIGPVKTLTVTFMSPFVAMFLDYILLNSQLTKLMAFGAVVIIIAIMISNNLVVIFGKKK